MNEVGGETGWEPVNPCQVCGGAAVHRGPEGMYFRIDCAHFVGCPRSPWQRELRLCRAALNNDLTAAYSKIASHSWRVFEEAGLV